MTFLGDYPPGTRWPILRGSPTVTRASGGPLAERGSEPDSHGLAALAGAEPAGNPFMDDRAVWPSKVWVSG